MTLSPVARARLLGLGAPLLGGVLVAASGPPFPSALVVCVFAGLALLAVSLEGVSVGRAAMRGFLFGFAANVVVFHFVVGTITEFTDLPWIAAAFALVLLAAGQSLPWVVAAIAHVLLRRRAPIALSLAGGAALALAVPQIFVWTVGAPLGRAPILMQLAEVIGERGLSVLVAATAGLLASAWLADGRARLRFAGAAMAIPLALLLYGVIRIPTVDAAAREAPHVRVGLVQHAVAPKIRWEPSAFAMIHARLWRLTREAEKQGATLAIWPEAAYPWVLPNEPSRDAGPFRIRPPGVKLEVLTGVLTDAPSPAGSEPGARWHFNAATLVGVDGMTQPVSAKIELLAFGEYVPFGETFPWLRRTFSRGGGLVAGKEVVLLETRAKGPQVRAGVLNCYEDTIPGLARRVAKAGPNLLVNVTNDAWFGHGAEPELHLLEAIPRAIELRRSLVRAVNTGVTSWVDPVGRVVDRAPREREAVLVADVPLMEGGPTPYERVGDLGWIAIMVTAIGLTLGTRKLEPPASSESYSSRP